MWPFKKKAALPQVVVNITEPKNDPSFVMTGDGNISLHWNCESHSVGKSHPCYEEIVRCLTNRTFNDLDRLLNVGDAITAAIDGVTVNEYGEVFYRGEPVHNTVATRITNFLRQGLDYKPLARFLANLMENPSRRSIEELYDFLEHQGLAITEDGCFAAYKGLDGNWKDRHTGTVDNSIGAKPKMKRQDVDDDARRGCSKGYHVGTFEYASGFALNGQVVLVKVNPRDAVSVPYDHDHQKLRVCQYEVMEECKGLIESPLFVPQAQEYDEDDICDECGDDQTWCECEEEEVPQVEAATGRARGPGGRFLPKS